MPRLFEQQRLIPKTNIRAGRHRPQRAPFATRGQHHGAGARLRNSATYYNWLGLQQLLRRSRENEGAAERRHRESEEAAERRQREVLKHLRATGSRSSVSTPLFEHLGREESDAFSGCAALPATRHRGDPFQSTPEDKALE